MARADTLNSQVADLQHALEVGQESGKKKAALTALNTLRDLLASGPGARANALVLRENRFRDGDSTKLPMWDGVLGRVLFHLSQGAKLVKADVEKLRLLVGAAVGAGAGALSSKAELKTFCYICLELDNTQRTPRKADKTSAHVDCVGVLMQLTSGRPQLLARLSPGRLRALLVACMDWISGENDPSAPADGPPGPHATVVSTAAHGAVRAAPRAHGARVVHGHARGRDERGGRAALQPARLRDAVLRAPAAALQKDDQPALVRHAARARRARRQRAARGASMGVEPALKWRTAATCSLQLDPAPPC